jgi:hypothetical protein
VADVDGGGALEDEGVVGEVVPEAVVAVEDVLVGVGALAGCGAAPVSAPGGAGTGGRAGLRERVASDVGRVAPGVVITGAPTTGAATPAVGTDEEGSAASVTCASSEPGPEPVPEESGTGSTPEA